MIDYIIASYTPNWKRIGLCVLAALLALSAWGLWYSNPYPTRIDTSVDTTHARESLSRDSLWASMYDIEPLLAHQIIVAAANHSVPEPIAFGLVSAESGFLVTAKSPVGALGLTQVMPVTGDMHCGLSPHGLLDPARNLDCGLSYLASMKAQFNSWRLALIAYNRGPGRTLSELRSSATHGTSEGYAKDVLSMGV